MITVAIPTLGDRPGLEDLLAALARQDFPESEREILIVGNLESPRLRRIVERWRPRIDGLRLEFTGVLGVNAARNLALDLARGELVVFFDDDCVPASAAFLAEVARLHREHPEAWAIGGFYTIGPRAGIYARTYVEISRDSLLRASFAGAPQGDLRALPSGDLLPLRGLVRFAHWRASLGGALAGARFGTARALNLLGGNVSYKRARLGARWRFDPRIRFGGAETEFHARLVAAGAHLVLAGAIPVEHRVRLGARAFLRRGYVQGRAWGLLCAQGLSPRLTLHASLAPPSGALAAKAFHFSFRLGADLQRIGLYEFGRYWRFRELARIRVNAVTSRARASLFLRELCYAWLALRGRAPSVAESRELK